MIEDRIADELAAFAPSTEISFEAVAITDEQVAARDIPEQPGAPGTYQAEALPPDVLADVTGPRGTRARLRGPTT